MEPARDEWHPEITVLANRPDLLEAFTLSTLTDETLGLEEAFECPFTFLSLPHPHLLPSLFLLPSRYFLLSVRCAHPDTLCPHSLHPHTICSDIHTLILFTPEGHQPGTMSSQNLTPASTPASTPLVPVTSPGTASNRRSDDLGHSDHLGVPAHSSQVIGTPVVLPTTSSGIDEMQPAQLAAYIFTLPYVVARNGRLIKGKILRQIIDFPARRELVLRPAKPMSTGRLNDMLTKKLYRVEAAVMQIVGTVQLATCRHCLQENGPFNQCVIVTGHIPCANCQWTGDGQRCSFLPQAGPSSRSATMPSPSGHRRSQSSLSSSASRESGDNENLTGTGTDNNLNVNAGGSMSKVADLVDEANLSTNCPALTQAIAGLQFDITTMRHYLEL
ncbi:uncharacterized protein N7482_009226 [Penicillium canariense]|uniref:Uncharacterized protein n=1 Tax=Penicillium canariense TaxID=189055 RepID=A0A9W9HMA6_9EURO|nr:uncharacterized protein N7482_009226 [Penicillium canariense]KAJ5152748.1 hypothetical protein N7482_009226 [Penicillium canariense]